MKLASKDLDALKALCPGNKVPDYPDPKSNDAYDIEALIQESLDNERRRKGLKKMSPERRAFYGLSTINSYFKADGLVTGVAMNDPELLAAAIEGAKAMKLEKVAKILEKAAKQFPPRSSWKSSRKRDAWFETAAGEKAAAKLADLENQLSDAEGRVGFVARCLKYALANPSEFFVDGSSKRRNSARN